MLRIKNLAIPKYVSNCKSDLHTDSHMQSSLTDTVFGFLVIACLGDVSF